MASTQQDALQAWIEKRVQDFFEAEIENSKSTEEQKIVAALARKVVAVIRQS